MGKIRWICNQQRVSELCLFEKLELLRFQDYFCIKFQYPQHHRLFATGQFCAECMTERLERLYLTPVDASWKINDFSITSLYINGELANSGSYCCIYNPQEVGDKLISRLFTLEAMGVFIIEPAPVQLRSMNQRLA